MGSERFAPAARAHVARRRARAAAVNSRRTKPANPRPADHEPLLGAHPAGPADPEAGAGGAFTAGASPAAAPPAAARPGSSAKWHEAARDALALKRVAGIAHSLGVLPGLDVTRDAVEYEKA